MGNIYRAIAYKIWISSYDPHDVDIAVVAAKDLKLSDLDNLELAHEQVAKYASIIGGMSELRKITYEFQRDFIDRSTAAIVEGRDIGTVICPEANYKFYLTADVEVRAKRRADENLDIDYQVILDNLKERDARDQNRPVAPLKPADDAVIIDNSNIAVEETLAMIGEIIIPSCHE